MQGVENLAGPRCGVLIGEQAVDSGILCLAWICFSRLNVCADTPFGCDGGLDVYSYTRYVGRALTCYLGHMQQPRTYQKNTYNFKK